MTEDHKQAWRELLDLHLEGEYKPMLLIVINPTGTRETVCPLIYNDDDEIYDEEDK